MIPTGLFKDAYILNLSECVREINSKQLNKDEIIIRIAHTKETSL